MESLAKHSLEFISLLLSSGVFIFLLKWVKEWWDEREIRKCYITRPEIQEKLQFLKVEVLASRVMVLRYHNGGRRPRTGNQSYVSVMYEEVADGYVPVRSQFQNYPLDQEYDRQLSEVVRSGHFCYTSIEELPDSGAKTTNRMFNVQAMCNVEIGFRGYDYYTLIVNFDHAEIFTEEVKEKIKLYAHQLKSLIK